jgi:hypothetical protein
VRSSPVPLGVTSGGTPEDKTLDIKIIALTLLICRIVSVAFILAVLRKQWGLLKARNHVEVATLRKVLFYLAVVILVGQFVPILIDSATLLDQAKRNAPSALGIAYAYSNALTAMISSLLLWLVYRVSERQNIGLRSDKS